MIKSEELQGFFVRAIYVCAVIILNFPLVGCTTIVGIDLSIGVERSEDSSDRDPAQCAGGF